MDSLVQEDDVFGDGLVLVTEAEGNQNDQDMDPARGGNATAASSSGRHAVSTPLSSPTAAAAVIDKHQARHQNRWLKDDRDGLDYRLKNGLQGKTFWCTKERSCFAWRPVRPTDLQPPIYVVARFQRFKLLVDRWLSYQTYLQQDPRSEWTERADGADRTEQWPENSSGIPPMGTILWWPYWCSRMPHRGGDSSTFELEVLDWNLRTNPSVGPEGWDLERHSPRQGWKAWAAEVRGTIDLTRPNPARLPRPLSELADVMKYEYGRWLDRDMVPPHRVRYGRPDTPMPYHATEAQIIRSARNTVNRRADHWHPRLSIAPLRLPSVDGPDREHPPKEGYDTVEDDGRKTRHKTYGIKRAAKWIMAHYEVGTSRWESSAAAVTDRVRQLWSKPLCFERYDPQHVHARHWMSFQIYRIAALIARETDWDFYDSDDEETSPVAFYSQVQAYNKKVAREIAEAEAHKYTMEILYDRVFDIVPELATRVRVDSTAVDECVHFFLDVMDINFDQMIEENYDFPLSNCVPDSPDYTREALGIWSPHVVASAKILVKYWSVQAGLPPPLEPLPRDPEPRTNVRLQSISMSRGRRTRESRAAFKKENDQAPVLISRAPLPVPDERGREESADEPARSRPRYQPREGEPTPPWQPAAAQEPRLRIAPPPGLELPAGGVFPPASHAPAKGKGKGRDSPYVQVNRDLTENPWSSMVDEPLRRDVDVAAQATTDAPTWYVPPGLERDLPRRPATEASSSNPVPSGAGSRRQPPASHSTRQDEVIAWASYRWPNWRYEDRRSWREWGADHDARHQQELRQQARRAGAPNWNHGRWCPTCNTYGAEWDQSCGLCGFRWTD